MQYSRYITGAKSPSTRATFALEQCAKDFQDVLRETSRLVQSSFCMEDLLASVDSVDKEKSLSIELNKLLMTGSFNLTKCASSEPDVSKNPKPPEKIPIVFGLEWLLEGDEMTVCQGVSFHIQQQWTQRDLISKVSYFFDTLSFMVSISFRWKLILKQIWQFRGQQWDKPMKKICKMLSTPGF